MKRYNPRPKSAAAKLRTPRMRMRKQLKMTQDHERQRRFTQWPLPGEEEMV